MGDQGEYTWRTSAKATKKRATKKGRRLPGKVKRQLVRDYIDGHSLPDVAVRNRVSVATAWKYVKLSGIPIRGKGSNGNGKLSHRTVVCGRKFCPRCGHWRHIVDFSCQVRNEDGSVKEFSSWCLACGRIRRREQAKDPAWVAYRREYDRIYADAKRAREGLPTADPTKQHFAAPPHGVIVRGASGRLLNPFSGDAVADHRLPIEPLEAEVLKFLAKAEVEANGSAHGTFVGITRLEALSGVPARRINGMLRRESGNHVSLHVADRLCMALGQPLELVYA